MAIADDIDRFIADGVVTLRGAFEALWIDHLRRAISTTRPTPLAHVFVDDGADRGGRFFSDMYLSAVSPEFRAFAVDSAAGELAARFLRSDEVLLVNDELLIKEPRTTCETPWHHDAPYWPLRGRQLASIWIPLDPVEIGNGALEYVAGSHRWGRRFHPRDFASGAPRVTAEDEVDLDVASAIDPRAIVGEPLEPGDCQIFDALTLHRASGNLRPDRRRRALVLRVAGDDVIYDPRPRTIPLLWGPPLAPGAPLRPCELFPRLWPRGP